MHRFFFNKIINKKLIIQFLTGVLKSYFPNNWFNNTLTISEELEEVDVIEFELNFVVKVVFRVVEVLVDLKIVVILVVNFEVNFFVLGVVVVVRVEVVVDVDVVLLDISNNVVVTINVFSQFNPY